MRIPFLALAAVGIAAAATATTAHATTYLTLTSAPMTIYNVFNVGGDDTLEQALPGTGSIYATTPLATITYTGAIDFNDPSAGSDTVGGFLATANGNVGNLSNTASNKTLSGTNYTNTTGIMFNFTLSSAETLTISHDDGVSLFANGNTTNDLLPVSASDPTTDVDSSATLGAGTYTLYYVEANGLPADLIVSETPAPEPFSLALLGTGLAGLGLVRKRRARIAV